MKLDVSRLDDLVTSAWDSSILEALHDYIKIPAQSPHFDPEWAENGYLDEAIALAENWLRAQELMHTKIEVHRLPGRTPLLAFETEGSRPDSPTVLLYGHLDKQPPFEGWRPGLGAWTPVRQGDKLYGRGGADDGYSVFASATAVRALLDQGAARPRIVGLFECSEESGSPDLPAYVDYLRERIGSPILVVCLDSGCGDYERLWATTSLRGMVAGVLRVDILKEGVHSGKGTGVAASSMRIARMLLDRVEDPSTGNIRLPALEVDIPEARVRQAHHAAEVLGERTDYGLPFVDGAQPLSDGGERLLNATWRAGLEITGSGGLPPIETAGNVLRPFTELKLSFRLPPTCDAGPARAAIVEALEADPPYGAKVRFESAAAATGWHAPEEAAWLNEVVDASSRAHFGPPAAALGEGGTIPFMHMLGTSFPEAQFLITGVLGPESNAHGPNEFLHIPTAKKLTACVAQVLARAADVDRG